MLSNLYNVLLYQPLLNLLVFFYNLIPGSDIGLAIIALTVFIKVLLYPLTQKSLKQQKVLQTVQPKLKEIQEKYKNDREKLAAATMALYRQEKVNPLSSCFPLLIQLPIFIAVYNVFRVGLTTQNFDVLYPFVQNPGFIDPLSFGVIDLSLPHTIPGLILALAAGVAQHIQARSYSRVSPPKTKEGSIPPGAKDESMMAIMNKQMLYMMPILTVVIGYNLPAGLGLYWLVTTLIMLIQQKFYFQKEEQK